MQQPDEFARHGFDVWTVDHENYGRSSRTEGNSDIRSGAADLAAAFAVVERVTGVKALMVYSQSSGAIRAGAYAMQAPERFDRLVLDAFTYTGEGAPEIMRRRAQVESYRARPYRPLTRETLLGIFTRDDPSTFEPAVAAAQAEYELALTDRAPSGTYLDMAVNLPLVDPRKVTCPVLMTRAATDGNATEAELLDFFGQLPNKDKQFAMLQGVTHVAALGINRHRLWHVMREFLTYPATRTASPAAGASIMNVRRGRLRNLVLLAGLLASSCAGLDRSDQGRLQPQTVSGPCRVEKFFILAFRSVRANMTVGNAGQACSFTLFDLNEQRVLTAAFVTGQPAHGRATVSLITADRQAAVSYTPNLGYVGSDQFSITLEPNALGVTVAVTVQPALPSP